MMVVVMIDRQIYKIAFKVMERAESGKCPPGEQSVKFYLRSLHVLICARPKTPNERHWLLNLFNRTICLINADLSRRQTC